MIGVYSKSEEPLYRKIYRKMIAQIACGDLLPGQLLPSIRSAARYLSVAVITVKAAYEDLERDGYIYTVPAKGCFVSENAPRLLKERNVFVEEAFEKFLSVCREKGLSEKEIADYLADKIKEE